MTDKEQELTIPKERKTFEYRASFRQVSHLTEEELNSICGTEIHHFKSSDDPHVLIDVYSLPINLEEQGYFKALPKRIQDILLDADFDEVEYVLLTL